MKPAPTSPAHWRTSSGWHPVRCVIGMRSPFAWSAGSSPRRRRATQALRPPLSSSGACSSSETSRVRRCTRPSAPSGATTAHVGDLRRATQLVEALRMTARGHAGLVPGGQRCVARRAGSVPGRIPHRHGPRSRQPRPHSITWARRRSKGRGSRPMTRWRRCMRCRAYPVHPGRPGRRRDRLRADGTPVRKAALPAWRVHPLLWAVDGNMDTHRSRPIRPRRRTDRRSRPSGRAARLRRMGHDRSVQPGLVGARTALAVGRRPNPLRCRRISKR